MARVTVEDCVEKVINRFELVALAAERGKQINSGAPIFVERDNDKDSVVALREIAEGFSIDALRESLTARLQKLNKIDEIESEDAIALDEDVGDDFGYVSDGSGFLIDDDSEAELDSDEVFEDFFGEEEVKTQD